MKSDIGILILIALNLEVHILIEKLAWFFVLDSSSKSCVPSRNCLDLYEEILTEEGTAKEATYNDVCTGCQNYYSFFFL